MRPLLILATTALLGLVALAVSLGQSAGAVADVGEVRAGGGVSAGEVAPAAPVQVFAESQTYPVQGDTPQQVLASMAAGAPRADGETFFGLTRTELAFRYRRSQGPDGCSLRDVRVDLSVRVSLPEWTPGSESTYDLRRDWARFRSSLRRHEDRHRVLAEQGAETIRAELDGLTTPTCPETDIEARTRAERVQIETEAAHRRYDDETMHGRTQGAVWPRP